jgi:cytoskeletal protein CcmA (bactofilin family)
MWKQEAPPQQEPSVKTEGTRLPQTADPAVAGRAQEVAGRPADVSDRPPDAARRPPDEEQRVVASVGKSVVFKGDLSSSEDMTIDGHVEGTVKLRDHGLTIGPNAAIRADIVARTVIVRGAVMGTITAGDKVVVSETGSVEGDVISPCLALADGAVLRGRVDTLAQQTEAGRVGRRLAAAP